MQENKDEAPGPNANPFSTPSVRITPKSHRQSREEEYLRICRYINSATPALNETLAITNNTPNTFLIYNVSMMIETAILSLRAFSNITFSELTSGENAGLQDNATVLDARGNITHILDSIARLNERIRQISYEMPIIRPPPAPVCHPAARGN